MLVASAAGCHSNGARVPVPTADLDGVDADGGIVRAKHKERCNGIDDDLDGKIDEGCPIRVSFALDADDQNVAIGGGRIAWNHPIRTDSGTRYELRVVPIPNSPTVAPYRVVDTESLAYEPGLAGDRVVYDRAYETGVIVRDLVTDQTWTPPMGGPLGSSEPVLLTPDGRRVLYSKVTGAGTQDVRVVLASWDIDAGSVTELSSTLMNRPILSTTGTQVAWLDVRDTDLSNVNNIKPDLWIADLATNATRRLVHLVPPAGIGPPEAFDGTRVYLAELHDLSLYGGVVGVAPACQLAAYDVATGGRMAIGESTHPDGDACASFSVTGSIAIFDDKRGVRELGASSDLYFVDFNSGDKKAITKYPRRSTAPQIWDGRLVWLDDRNDVLNVYMMDLRDVDQGDLSPEGVTP